MPNTNDSQVTVTFLLEMEDEGRSDVVDVLPDEVPDLFLLGGSSVEVGADETAAIVFRAAQLVLLHRAGRPFEEVISRLDELLTDSGVIDIEF